MIDVLYSLISTAPGTSIDDAIRYTSKMGYRLTAFEGWTDNDLGTRFGDSKGPSRDTADRNQAHLKFINENCNDQFAILDIAETPNDGLLWVRAK